MSGTNAGDREVIISRVFNAPRERVWRVWTEQEHVAHWWGPERFTNPLCELDVRDGGAYRIVMRSPDGVDYPMKGVFRDVAPPERLVMTMDLSGQPDEWYDMLDPHRDKSAGPPDLQLATTITFEETGEGTRVTVQADFDNPALREAMLKMGMKEGWAQSLDKFSVELAAVSG